jgi:hypothetical protein
MIALPCACGQSIEEHLGEGPCTECPCIAYEADEFAGVHPDLVKKIVEKRNNVKRLRNGTQSLRRGWVKGRALIP